MQATKKGFLNIFYGLLGQLLIICMGIIIPRLVLVNYGSEMNGLLNSVTQIFTYFNLFEAGIGVASMQALYAPVANQNKEGIQGILAATHLFYRKTGLMYAAAVVLLAFGYPFFVHTSINYWIIVGVVSFGGLGNCLNFLYQGKYKILMEVEGYGYICTNITTLINIITNLVKVLLIMAGYHVLYVQISFFLINILQMFFYSIYVRKHYAWIDLKGTPDHSAISQKGATLVHQVAGTVFYSTDTLLLTVMTHDLKIVSVYTMYNTILQMVSNLLTQIMNGFNFRLGQIYNTDKEQYRKLYHIVEILCLIIVFSAMTVLYLFYLPFMRLYTAGVKDVDYVHAIYPLFFVLSALSSYGRLVGNNVINFAGHFKQTQWRAVAETVINIVVSVWGVWNFGILGALFGSIIAGVYRTIDIAVYTYRHLIHDNIWKSVRRWCGCAVVFASVAAFMDQNSMRYSSYFDIVIFGCLYLIGFLVIYTVVQVVLNRGEFRELFCIIRGYAVRWKRKN